MALIDTILGLDILAAILAAVLFIVGRIAGPPLSERLALPIKVLLVFALVVYLATEVIIGKEFNVLFGAIFVLLAAAVFYFFSRPKNRA